MSDTKIVVQNGFQAFLSVVRQQNAQINSRRTTAQDNYKKSLIST